MGFLLCSGCQRHVKDSDSACPFCQASLDGAAPAGNRGARSRSRLAVLFGATTALVTSAAAATACSSSSSSGSEDAGPTTTAVAAYGVAVPEDSGVKDAGQDGPSAVAAYGVAVPPDSGSD